MVIPLLLRGGRNQRFLETLPAKALLSLKKDLFVSSSSPHFYSIQLRWYSPYTLFVKGKTSFFSFFLQIIIEKLFLFCKK